MRFRTSYWLIPKSGLLSKEPMVPAKGALLILEQLKAKVAAFVICIFTWSIAEEFIALSFR